jgi:exosortase K
LLRFCWRYALYRAGSVVLSTLKQARQSLIWWLPAAGIAAALKWHFSAADSAALGWMLQPLSLSLRWLAGWHFLRSPAGDWASSDAGIVLVKACAGINFMTMSFIGWCAMLRPQAAQVAEPAAAQRRSALLEWSLRFVAALLLAWFTALAVNTLRVIAVVAWQPTLQHWLAPATAHRLIGLIIYLSALTLQLMRGEAHRLGRAALVGAAIYIAVMVLVPLLTGNAAANATAYREHAWVVLAIALPLAVAGVVGRPLRAPVAFAPRWRTMCGIDRLLQTTSRRRISPCRNLKHLRTGSRST